MSNSFEQETVQKRMKSAEFLERLARDNELTTRIQAGFFREEPSQENPRPLVTDGELTTDAQEALGELFEHYQPFIWSIAYTTYNKMNHPPAFSEEDLVQEGFHGLFRAALRWSPDDARGGFLSYAKIGIKQYVYRRGENAKSCIRLSEEARTLVKRYRGTYWSEYGRTENAPRRERIAGAMGGISLGLVDYLADLEAMTDQMGSLDGGYYEDERDQHSTYSKGEGRWRAIDPSATEMREVEQDILLLDLKRVVEGTLTTALDKGKLDARSIQVLKLRYFGEQGINEPLTLEEVGKQIGVTRERVRQIEIKALAQLRQPDLREKLLDLL